MFGVWAYHLMRIQHERAAEDFEESLKYAENYGVIYENIKAHAAATASYVFMGQPQKSLDCAKAGWGMYDVKYHNDLVALYWQDTDLWSADFGSWAAWLLGQADDAADRYAGNWRRDCAALVAGSPGWAISRQRQLHCGAGCSGRRARDGKTIGRGDLVVRAAPVTRGPARCNISSRSLGRSRRQAKGRLYAAAEIPLVYSGFFSVRSQKRKTAFGSPFIAPFISKKN
jgi:hypothetical protein